MKKIFYIILTGVLLLSIILFLIPTKQINKLNAEIGIEKGETWTYSEKISLELIEIRDSRCPEGVQCIWSGEISADLKLIDMKSNNSSNITLGIITNPSSSFSSYKISILEKSTPEIIFLHIEER